MDLTNLQHSFSMNYHPSLKLWLFTHVQSSFVATLMFDSRLQMTLIAVVSEMCCRRLTWCSMSAAPRIAAATRLTWS